MEKGCQHANRICEPPICSAGVLLEFAETHGEVVAVAQSRPRGDGTIYAKCHQCAATTDGLGGGRYRCPKCGCTKVRWQGQIHVTDPATGERRRVTVYGKTKTEVGEKLHAVTKGAEDGTSMEAERTSLKAWIERWLRDVVPVKTKPVTQVSYRRTINTHIIPALGAHMLSDLRPTHVQRMISNMLQKGLAKRTAEYAFSLTRSSLAHAVAQRLLLRNPCDGVTAPHPDKRERQAHTPQDVNRLLEAVRGNKWEELIHLAVYTGMRRAELLGLRWGDLRLGADGDPDRGYAHISQVASELSATKVELGTPKTVQSRRTIALPPEAVDVLRRLKAEQRICRIAMNKHQRQVFEDHDLVFCKPTGLPLQPQRVSESVRYYLDLAGLNHLRPLHDNRHAAADLMLQAGVDLKTVSEHLGHSTIRITADIYTAVPTHMKAEAAEALSNILKNAPTSKGGPPGNHAQAKNKASARQEVQ